MANSSTPIRVDAELLDAAKLVGRRQSRSAAQQIAHWARVGREIEASRSMSVHAIAGVLGGRRSYDSLDREDQAIVRAEWANRLDADADGIDLSAVFNATGRRTWIDIAADGTIVRREAGATHP
ncbi:MAG: TA system antitoxin ParD family protein [Acidimicrobiales bacterium]